MSCKPKSSRLKHRLAILHLGCNESILYRSFTISLFIFTIFLFELHLFINVVNKITIITLFKQLIIINQ